MAELDEDTKQNVVDFYNSLMRKNVTVATLLALFFGGFGMLYSSVLIGMIFSVIEVVLLLVVYLTKYSGLVICIIWHALCAIFAFRLVRSFGRCRPEDLNNYNIPQLDSHKTE